MDFELTIPPNVFSFSVPSNKLTFLLSNEVLVTDEMRANNALILRSMMTYQVINKEVNTAFDFLGLDGSNEIREFLSDHRRSFLSEPRGDKELRDYWLVYAELHENVTSSILPDLYHDLMYGA